MKIIDLLNKIANGEEVPKYIKYRDISKHKYNTMMTCKENIIYQLDQCVIDLNDEVEILEEENKVPEQINKSYNIRILDLDKSCIIKDYDMEQLIEMVQDIYSKQSEIIDYLKSKGE